MKSISFVVIIFLFLFVQYAQQTTENLPITTPSAWAQGLYPAACNAIGTSKIIQDPATVIPLTTRIYLKTSYVYQQYTDSDGNQVYTQNIFKSYISVQNSDGTQTILQIVSLSGVDGTKVSQTFTIKNTYEFIDADGPYVLLKQTDASGTIILTLYSFDSSQGATTLKQLAATPISTYPDEIFQAVQVNLVSNTFFGYQLPDSNFQNIVGTVLSRNTASQTAVVRQIISSGLDNIVYSFALSDITSEVYTNLLLGLQINGNTFHTYVSPAYGSGNAPYVYLESTDQISTATDLWNNNIVITFLQSMMVATFDDDRKNGNIFFLLSDTVTYSLSLVNMKTTRTAPQASPAASLQYLTDHSSYIIELDLNPNTNTFFMVWASDENMYNLTFLNTPQDQKNSQIVADFTNPSKISSFIFGKNIPNTNFYSLLHMWIYKTTGITKYIFSSLGEGGTIESISINKEFAIELDENLLMNSAGPNFEITTQLKCVCQNTQVTEMICFYGNNACTFTVQTLSVYCTPNIA